MQNYKKPFLEIGKLTLKLLSRDETIFKRTCIAYNIYETIFFKRTYSIYF